MLLISTIYVFSRPVLIQGSILMILTLGFREKEDNAIIIASYGTFSTGINIKNLHNVIFASPNKSKIRNLQSIGRVLRKGDNKIKATLFDIADDITYGSSKNYTLNHMMERVKIYNEENFNYEMLTIPLKKCQINF